MIKIYNEKLRRSILIDDSVDWVIFTPRDYDDIAHVVIEFKDFNYVMHAPHCPDCKDFTESFGKKSSDWYITWENKLFRLDTEHLGQKGYGMNQIKNTVSDYEDSSKLILIFHALPTEKSELESYLKRVIEEENYEEACRIRDLITEKSKLAQNSSNK